MKKLPGMFVFAAGMMLALCAHAFADVYLEGTAGNREFRVWISGDKAKTMYRITEETSQKSMQNMGKSITSVIGSPQKAIEEIEIKLGDKGRTMFGQTQKASGLKQELESMKGYGKGDTTELKKQIADLESMKAQLSGPDGQKYFDAHKSEIEAAIIGTSVTTASTSSPASQEWQKGSLTVDIFRIDKGLRWEILTKDLQYKEDKLSELLKKGKSTNVPVMPSMTGAAPSLESKELGEQTIAGHTCKGYLFSLGTVSDEIWAAQDMDAAGKELNVFNAQFFKEMGYEILGYLMNTLYVHTLYNNADYISKVQGIKGAVLKRVITQDMGKMFGGSSAMMKPQSVSLEITKVGTDSVDAKEFDLPEGLKKVK